MKKFKIMLIAIGLLIVAAGYIIASFLDESEGGLLILLAVTLGAIFIIFGLTLVIAKIISDKVSKKQ